MAEKYGENQAPVEAQAVEAQLVNTKILPSSVDENPSLAIGEDAAFNAVAGLGIDTVETVLLYHVIPGATIDSAAALESNGAVLATAAEGKNTKVLVSDAPSIRLRDYAPKFKNAQVILDAVDINKGNMQIAHGVDAVMLPFAP